MLTKIKKRNGTYELFNPEKLNKWAEWASDINGVEWASIALDAVKKCYDGCTTSELQSAMITACIDREDEAHMYMAGRLYAGDAYKTVFGDHTKIPTLKEMYYKMILCGLWGNMNYSDEELDYLQGIINHDLDLTYPYTQFFQIKEKYAITDRVANKCFETPQFVFMRVALGVMNNMPKERRIEDVVAVYEFLSNGILNAPSPYMLYLGTNHRGLASCFPPGVPVSTLSGVKKIEDVQNGDYVLTHNGNYKKVYHTSNKPYVGKFVRINTTATFTDDFVSTQDHRIFTIKSNSSRSILNDLGNNTPEWVAADNIRLGDYVKIGLCTDTVYEDVFVYDVVRNNYLMSDFLLQDNLILKLNVDNSINQRQDAIVNFNIRSDVFFRLLGYYIAEGCVCIPSRPNSEHLIFTFNSKEVAFISDVVSILEGYGCAVSINSNPLDNSTKISVHSKVLCALMLELAGTGFNNKKLSQIILLSDIELQKHLLAGVIRGDGSAIIGGFSLTLYNVDLISQIRDIALRCKISIRISKSSKLKSGATCIDANICFNIDGNSTFALLVNKDIHKIRKGKSAIGRNIVFLNDGVYARVRMISSYEEECTVYDLSVEDDASFVVNGISVHNCCVYISDDNIPSLSVGDYIAYMMTCASAGIGGTLLTRSKGDPVRNGTIEHLGKLPYLKYTESGVNANKQAGRGGAATMYFSVLDPELGDLLKLRHPTTVDEKKIKDIDYGLAYNASFIRRGALNQDWMLISYLHAPDLWHALYSADVAKFDELYEKYEKSDLPKKFVPARSIVKEFLTNSYEVGRLYEFAADNVNGHTPFKETIWSSNLCVAPETMILTNQGYVPIHLLENQNIDIWNGHQWSNVHVVKTGTNQKLFDITTDSGQSISCTPYHKFYIFDGYNKPYKEVRAHELKPGDALCKFDLPIVNGQFELDNAYINGFYSGDGCLAKEGQRIYLYNTKRNLTDKFSDGSSWIIQEDLNRQYKHYTNLKDKFFVPTASYSVKSRLDWLAGYLDADGCVYSNGTNQQLTASSIELEFLKEVQLMLQTLGVSSKIKEMHNEGFKLLPKNDGSGDLDKFWCQKSYRLLISSSGSYKLLQLGLKLHRLQIANRLPQREAERFIKVVSVVDNGRIDDTYCFTEHEIGMGMFNGLLTGQCAEIALVTKPFKDIMDLYNPDSEGEIGLCQLMAICAGRVTPQTYEKAAYYALLMIDNAIDIMNYPFPSLDASAKARRSAGVGITNLAYDLAYRGLTYNSQAGKDYIHRHAEMHSYWLHEASLRLAKEKGLAPWIHKTKYPDGWLPIDTYNRNVDNITSQKLMYDWEDLRRRIIENGGIRNSVLEAHMPCESSSLASNTTNGLYPIRQGVVIKIDGNTKKVFIAPGWDDLKYQYQLAWSIEDNDMTDCYAIVQKFTGQLISADYYVKYNSDGSKRQLSFKDMFAAFTYRHKMGLGSRYYINSATGATVPVEEKGCAGGACVL